MESIVNNGSNAKPIINLSNINKLNKTLEYINKIQIKNFNLK